MIDTRYCIYNLSCVLLVVIGCKEATREQPPTVEPAYQINRIVSSRNHLFTTAHSVGVVFDSSISCIAPVPVPPVTAFTPTPAEVLQAEAILRQCTGEATLAGWPAATAPLAAHTLLPLAQYYRQYYGRCMADGQRFIWINALHHTTYLARHRPYVWQIECVQVEDGGNAYFNVWINLTTKECRHFFRNSSGG